MKKTQWKSSMPKKPAFGRAKNWTQRMVDRCWGRFIRVGWVDSPAMTVLVTGGDGSRDWDFIGLQAVNSKGHEVRIDGPDQVIYIGEKLRFPKFSDQLLKEGYEPFDDIGE